MQNRSASLLTLLLTGLLLTTADAARAQRPTGDGPRAGSDSANCALIVTGAVRGPSRFAMQRRVRLLEALGMAGGLTERAMKTVQVARAAPESGCEAPSSDDASEEVEDLKIFKLSDVISGDEKFNLLLRPGDIVTVPEADVSYVIGAVRWPQEILLKEPLTITQAITLAGGMRPGAETNQAIIYRCLEDGGIAPAQIEINLETIKDGSIQDALLQPSDILSIPGKMNFRAPIGMMRCPIERPAQSAPSKLPLRIIK